MKQTILRSSAAPSFTHTADLTDLAPQLEALATEIIAAGLSATEMTAAMTAGVTALSSLLRNLPVFEGRLLERGIRLLAGCNPDLIVLSDNIRLPVSPAALQLVEKNEETLYRKLTLDIDAPTRKTYTPDFILVDRARQLAHVVDVKRSLSSYESTRIAELKSRMLAGALVVPDLLYRDHFRLVVKDVRVVIIEVSGSRSDIERGVWPLTHLDHLLDVGGAAAAITELRRIFQSKVDGNWRIGTTALRALGGGGALAAQAGVCGAPPAGEPVEATTLAFVADNGPEERADPPANDRGLRVGFAKLSLTGRR